jgi:hypothetical protein
MRCGPIFQFPSRIIAFSKETFDCHNCSPLVLGQFVIIRLVEKEIGGELLIFIAGEVRLNDLVTAEPEAA